MNKNQAGPNNLLDTTDSLEAVGVFRGWKNFFFVIVILCLLLLQLCFLPVDRGYIKIGDQAGSNEPAVAGEVTKADEGLVEVTTETVQDVDEPAKEEAVEQKSAPWQTESTTKAAALELEQTTGWTPANILSRITFEQLTGVIRLINAVLILTAILYCLTLLFSLKVSMHGKLGGINHISRAFFLSLLVLVLLLPWQKMFGSVVTGAIFTPDELVEWYSAETNNIFDTVLYYLRFSGYWLLILLLLIFSQFRSLRWTKAILSRLEII
ncbi:MAG: hypothetical protein ACYTFW_15865 [Planctomycetota bacterium]|jgi:hypothetical protein